MTISSVQQRAGGTNLDAIAALRTIQPAAEGADDRVGAAIAGFDGFLAHPFITDARATFAKNATLRIVRDHGREILLRLRIFALDKTFFEIAPVKSQFLQFAFAAAIADRTVERVIREQKLEHRPLRLFNLFALRSDNHAVRARDGAGGLQLWHFLDAHQAHATRRL